MADEQLPHLTVQERPAKNMAARLEGVLAVDEATNCVVVLKSDHPVEVAWPSGCTVVERGPATAVLDGDGQTVGELGAVVVLGGGYVAPERAHVSSRTGRATVFAVAGAYGLPTRPR